MEEQNQHVVTLTVGDDLYKQFHTLLKDLYQVDLDVKDTQQTIQTIVMTSLRLFLDMSFIHAQGSKIVVYPTEGAPFQWKPATRQE